MAALLAELASEFGEGRIFRPYRDVRFSADKSPYKTAIAARVGEGYVQLSADGLMAGAGMYHMAPDQLDRYRRAVVDDGAGAALEETIAALGRGKIDVHGSDALEDRAQGLPEGPPPGRPPPQQGARRHEAVEARRVARHHRGQDPDRRSCFRGARPLTGWLDEHVGPSTLEDRGRR